MKSLRYDALQLLLKTLQQGESFSLESLEHSKKSEDLRFVKGLCYGVLRYYFQLDHLIKLLVSKKIAEKDFDVTLLLMMGLYELFHSQHQAYAIIHEIVEITKKTNKKWASGFINAVLRNSIRNRETLLQQCQQSEIANYAHPKWLITKIKKDYPLHYQTIFKENNELPPIILRVNLTKITRENYLLLLSQNNINASLIEHSNTAIFLESHVAIQTLPGFSEGWFFVQDSSAQWAAELLDVKSHQLILDACAAPGGKTTHILQTVDNQVNLVAVDNDATRIKRIVENLARLKLNAEVIEADVLELHEKFPPMHFDRILLDAPCSGTGVIRRHPDIKLLRRPKDAAKFAEQQLKFLHALWPLLKKEGKLLYATCSIFPEENEHVIKAFLSQYPDAKEMPLVLPEGVAKEQGWQILPAKYHDGFYYCLLSKL